MSRGQTIVAAWCGMLCLGLALWLAVPTVAQSSRKTFVEGGERELIEWAITPAGRLLKTRIIPAPQLVGIDGQSPTGEAILYRKNAPYDELYLADREGQNEQDIPHTDDRVISAHWDWTGEQFLFLTYGKRGAWVGEIQPDQRVRVREVAQGVKSASFSPDGKQLILERWPDSERPGLWLMNLADGSERLVSTRVNELWGHIGYAPEWTAEGRYVLFVHKELASTYSKEPHYQHPFWVLDLEKGAEYHLRNTTKQALPVSMYSIFWSERGDQLVYFEAGLNEKRPALVSLTIDLTAMAITKVEILGEAEPIRWIERGKLLLVEGPAVLDLTGSRVKVIRQASVPRQREELDVGPRHSGIGETCPVIDARLYQIGLCRPIAGGDIGNVGFFSHSSTNSCTTVCTPGVNCVRYDCSAMNRSGHEGIDFRTTLGAQIFASATGRVLTTGMDCTPSTSCNQAPQGGTCPAQGNFVRIGHVFEAGHPYVRT